MLLLDIQWCESQKTNSCSDYEEFDLLERDELLDKLDDGINFMHATTASHTEPELPARVSIERMLIEQQSDELCRQVRDKTHEEKEMLFFEDKNTSILSRSYKECMQVVVLRSLRLLITGWTPWKLADVQDNASSILLACYGPRSVHSGA